VSGRWFVSGAAGFIGSNLCEHLLRAGCRVIGFDNFVTGKRRNVERVAAVQPRCFEFIDGDVRDRPAVAQAIEGADVVVHLAAQGSVQKSFADVHYNNEVNVGGFLNVLTAAATRGVRRFVYASSCSVYGENANLPLKETEAPAPLSPYAVSKLADDLYAATVRHRYPSMSIYGLRFFNIFGPWQDPEGDYAAVIPKWVNALVAGERGVIFGDGAATRDFCYVGNVCNLISNLGDGESRPGGIYNIGTGQATSLNELYRSIVSVLEERGVRPQQMEPDYRPWRAGDILHSKADISRARAELDFAPEIGLLDGIRRILQEQYQR
jgi:UDP-N-acetylglucosamine 4-epimerase